MHHFSRAPSAPRVSGCLSPRARVSLPVAPEKVDVASEYKAANIERVTPEKWPDEQGEANRKAYSRAKEVFKIKQANATTMGEKYKRAQEEYRNLPEEADAHSVGDAVKDNIQWTIGNKHGFSSMEQQSEEASYLEGYYLGVQESEEFDERLDRAEYWAYF